MSIEVERILRWSDEDAYQFVVDTLSKLVRKELRNDRNVGFDIDATYLFNRYCENERIIEQNDKLNITSAITPKILTALWRLCLRGVLRPSVRNLAWDKYQEAVTGTGYSLTAEGNEWLKDPTLVQELMAPSSIMRVLQRDSELFGAAYQERVWDALRSLDAGAYFACCAMCGAACEAIFLALAIAKDGDADRVSTIYGKPGGRAEIRKIIDKDIRPNLKMRLSAGFDTLSWWRDHSAHGMKSGLGSHDARAAVFTLQATAQVAVENWKEITGCQPQMASPPGET